jgi:hypothetical protein
MRLMITRWNRLSDEAKGFIRLYKDHDTVDRFYIAAMNYMMLIEERYYTEDSDDDDYRTLAQMLNWLSSNLNELETEQTQAATIMIDED